MFIICMYSLVAWKWIQQAHIVVNVCGEFREIAMSSSISAIWMAETLVVPHSVAMHILAAFTNIMANYL